jgi:hypothetical protein
MMIRPSVIYENRFNLDLNRAFNLANQWLNSQHKAKIKKSTPPSFIEAKQGTLMANSGHDPNWKKRIRINLYQLEQNKILIRIEAMPIARNILRIEKLKQSWYNGLFSHLFSILQSAQATKQNEEISKKEVATKISTKYCSNCGKEVDANAIICPRCGVDIN